MSYLDTLLFGVYPYLAGSVFLLGSLARFERDQFTFSTRRRIEVGDQAFARLSVAWSDTLRHGFVELPEFHL